VQIGTAMVAKPSSVTACANIMRHGQSAAFDYKQQLSKARNRVPGHKEVIGLFKQLLQDKPQLVMQDPAVAQLLTEVGRLRSVGGAAAVAVQADGPGAVKEAAGGPADTTDTAAATAAAAAPDQAGKKQRSSKSGGGL